MVNYIWTTVEGVMHVTQLLLTAQAIILQHSCLDCPLHHGLLLHLLAAVTLSVQEENFLHICHEKRPEPDILGGRKV